MDFEDILAAIGDYGRYQKRLVWLFLVPVSTLLPWFSVITLFLVAAPDHWCYVPELANFTQADQKSLIKAIINEKADSCSMYDVNYAAVALTGSLPQVTGNGTLPYKLCDKGWTYDTQNYDETAATFFNLVCDDSQYPSWILSLGAIGGVVGTPFFGWLSDRIGRKITFYITFIVFIISSMSPLILKDLTSFTILRFVHGLVMVPMCHLPYVLAVELVGPETRTRMTAITMVTWTSGLCTLPIIAYWTRHWVWLTLLITSIAALVFCYWNLLPESPRWLISKGRFEEAKVLLTEMAKANGRPVPRDLLRRIQLVGKKLSSENRGAKRTGPLQLFKRTRLRNIWLLITYNWIAADTAYGGLTLNATHLYGNEFLNFFLLAVVEFPSLFVSWYFMETKMGRRWTNFLCLASCGISLCAPALIPESLEHVTVYFALFGKFWIAAAFMLVFQVAAELYPTPLRSQGMALSSTVSSFCMIFLPQLTYFGRYGAWIPMVIMGIISLMASVCVTFLPESLNQNLPQTEEDADHFGKGQKYWSWAPDKPVAADEKSGKTLEICLQDVA